MLKNAVGDIGESVIGVLPLPLKCSTMSLSCHIHCNKGCLASSHSKFELMFHYQFHGSQLHAWYTTLEETSTSLQEDRMLSRAGLETTMSELWSI